MKVNIPFKHRFTSDLMSGYKTCTSRTKQFGKAGDIFEHIGAKFVITKVETMKLNQVADNLYQQEGFNSPTEFIQMWSIIHPIKQYQPSQIVFVHHFRRLEIAT